MLAFLVRRLVLSAFMIVTLSLIVFVALYAIGDPVALLAPPDATQLERARIAAEMGLDQPLPAQYLRFLHNLFRGDLGRSFVYGIPALQLILERLPATLELALSAMLLALAIGIPLGMYAGLHANRWPDRVISLVAVLGNSLPTFWVGLMLIMVLSVWLGWLPASGRGATRALFGVPFSFVTLDGLRHLALPAANLALFNVALVIRLVRATTREVLPLDYIRFARAKGLRERRVVGVHALKNIMNPVLTVIGLQFGSLVAFAIVTESVFSWPGMGKLIIDSIRILDRPVVVAYLMFILALFIVINLLIEIAYSILDPRIRMRSTVP
ncbi:ABC transporter permease (plasmid) [Massilia forsythiae]|uniref:ABC transporter permease n=1 Tax=Massilia forsythiae TaxID=2728020 RepID=A0A7Z2W2Q0_9BURK|nr:ABC transporter permease [Massilia forsythiae]QJE03660.1 ABC transporter permease [Massilia forsythiae]